MSRDKPLWQGRGIKTATFQMLRFEDLHLPNQVVIWQSNADPRFSLNAVISHSDWGEASKLQHFKCSVLKTCMCFIKLWYDIWQSKAPKWWFQILFKWAVINHSDWGEASKRHHFKCSVLKTASEAPFLKIFKLWYDRGAFFEDLHLPNQAAIWHMTVQGPKMLTPDSL